MGRRGLCRLRLPLPLLLLPLLLLGRAASAGGGKLGSACSRNHECAVRVAYSECRERRCVCRENLLASADESRCLPPLKLRYRCEEQVQCAGVPHAACLPDERGYQHCLCKPAFVLYADRCLPRVKLREACELTAQCGKNMVCEAGSCVCKGFAYERHRQCIVDPDDYVGLDSSSTQLLSSLLLILVSLLPLL
ncbi:uncharacterized protein ZC84.1-like [Schistocerca gregaria]|uniref:uncharacterized protein ZC84.1-like n=1 Tax=Schistocerca gregaria TaxID=7010 RepID=UPI00211E2DB1|nr:uncharacterized protein ZC84.1-like [Schistocerca gregaria]